MIYFSDFSVPLVGGNSTYKTNENLGSQSVSTTLADLVTLSAAAGEMTNGAQYLIFWSVDAEWNIGNNITAALKIGATIVNSQVCVPSEITSPIDKTVFGGFVFHTAGSGAETFTVQAMRANGSGTISLTNARATYLKLGPDDFTVESLSEQDTTSTSLQTAATLSFTPASTGNYIAVASFLCRGTSGNGQTQFEFSDGTTTIGTFQNGALNTTNTYQPVFLVMPLGSVSGAKTVTVKYRSPIGNQVFISQVRIAAFREDRFANVYKTTLASPNSGTETSYTTALSQTFTPAAADHLELVSMQLANGSNTESAYVQFLDGATVVDEHIREPSNGSTVRAIPSMAHRVVALPASSLTQAIQRKGEATNTNILLAGSSIVTISMAGQV